MASTVAVNKELLELFYSISPVWTIRDQRLLSAVGFEFELCEYAFIELYKYCERETDYVKDRWSVNAEDAVRVAILARAFIDHAVRVPKLIKMLSLSGPSAADSDAFIDKNRQLLHLRNALHHADERLNSGESTTLIQPSGGDFSWKTWTPVNTVDVYWISFGSHIEDQASPTICTTTTFKRTVDHLTYRAHDQEANLCDAFDDLCTLVVTFHDHVVTRFDDALKNLGIKRGSKLDERLPAGMNGRLRLAGLEASSS